MILVAFSWAAILKGFTNFLSIAWQPLLVGTGGIVLAHLIWYGPKIDNLELKYELEQQQNSRLESVIKSQNEAITKASEASQRTFDELLEDIRNTVSDRERNTDEIIERIIEAGKPETCTEAGVYLLEQLDNLRWDGDTNE